MAWLVDVDDVRPNPSCDQRRAARPKAIRARFRTACTATWGSSEQACTQRSPSDRVGSSLSAGKCGSSSQRRGLPGASPKRSFPSVAEQARSEAEGDGQSGRRQPDGLAGVVRRRFPAPEGAGLAGLLAPGHLLGGGGPGLQQLDQLLAGLGGDVERREVQAVLRRRGDAGLVLAAERVRRDRRRRLRRGAARRPADREHAGHPGGGRAATEEPASTDPHASGQHRRSQPRRAARTAR